MSQQWGGDSSHFKEYPKGLTQPAVFALHKGQPVYFKFEDNVLPRPIPVGLAQYLKWVTENYARFKTGAEPKVGGQRHCMRMHARKHARSTAQPSQSAASFSPRAGSPGAAAPYLSFWTIQFRPPALPTGRSGHIHDQIRL